MPCDTVTTSTVTFERANMPRLLSAIQSLKGWFANYDPRTGQLVADSPDGARLRFVRGSSDVQITASRYSGTAPAEYAATVKRAYAVATVHELAKRYGFAGKASTTQSDGTIKIRFGK